MRWIFVFFFIHIFGADFDCVFVGTSPIPLFEALYQRQLGKSVLILEQDAVCGGAWKGISICGLENVDVGCHQIGYSPQLKEFLETYAGCNVIAMEDPKTGKNVGLYFSKGCHELIDHLVQSVSFSGISLLLNHRLESVHVGKEELTIKTADKTFTTKQLFYTPMTDFAIENPPPSMRFFERKPKYYHIYLLIYDPTPPQFSYKGFSVHGASRIMNLTYSLGLEKFGRQLVVFQVYSEEAMKNGPLLFNALKNKNLISPSAYILKEEFYIYETGCAPQRFPAEWACYFKNLQTSGFLSMIHHIPRWKETLKPFREIFSK